MAVLKQVRIFLLASIDSSYVHAYAELYARLWVVPKPRQVETCLLHSVKKYVVFNLMQLYIIQPNIRHSFSSFVR